MHVEIVQLQDIDISRLTLIKESLTALNGADHARWVFRQRLANSRGSRQVRYLKIWNPHHVRRDNILRAMDAGFYDDSTAPALTAVIFHNGICRGYITNECQLTYRVSAAFYNTIKQRTIETQHFAIQFQRNHVGLSDGRYSLFDLEGVHPLSDLPNMAGLHSTFDDPVYGDFVVTRFRETYPDRRIRLQDCGLKTIEQSWLSESQRILDSVYAIRKLRFSQWQARQWVKARLLPAHTHLIEI